ncbi:BTAD domain-containing putative transcriptional regulator [Mycolicibacterium elephantis]|uniref:BTAD domain-containing putative transcriptional regulator n=1 Tax=Mycolicibacterium elephantis TaxID=81858 RepID=UPI003A8B46F5
MLGLHGGTVVSADVLLELLWGDEPPRTAAKALQTHISSLRRALGDGFIVTEGAGWTLCTTEVDATRYKAAIRKGRDAIAAGDAGQAVAHFDKALALWRGVPELPDGPRGASEKTRWLEGHASLVEDRADAVLATGRAAEIIGELEAAVAEAPLRERRWGQLMLALYRAGRQGEALGAYQRARSLLADELGVDPGPDLRRLEAAIVAQDSALEVPVAPQLSVTRAVTFLLTDIEGSTAAWEADAEAMAVALARHDEIVEQVVTSRGGRLIKTRGEGDATFSVFDRPSGAAMAAVDLQEAIRLEFWNLAQPMRVRVALHTGEVELRDGDYFGRAVNRAARLRSLATGGQILCSGATAELVIDSLPEDVVLADLGSRQLRNLARPEHVFELRLQADESPSVTSEEPFERPALPAVLAGLGPFVGRGHELGRLLSSWQVTLAEGTRAVLIAGEPGVGKTRLAGEWSRQAYEQGAVVLYGRCDEDLGAPYQPFAEALRSLVPSLGTDRLRGLRGVEALLPLVPRLTDVLPDLAAPHHADPDTERYALFDAVVGLLGIASAAAPVVVVLDDLHWAAKPTLLLMRHLLRFGEHARVQIVGTYRSTDLDRSHPLAAMLADLHRDGSADRLALGGLDEDEVAEYVVEAGYDDEELAQALASVTGGNPFFLIEALCHVDESGGHWDPSTLPQGIREAVSRRLSRLQSETNKALAAAAVVGSRFAIDLVERVMDRDLVDAFDEACKAGIVIEEQGGRYRFNHALVRQALLAELPSVRRMRLHQHIAATLEAEPGADEDLLDELAYHYFECAWAGNAAKAVHYCRRAADQAMARLAYESAADHYDRALHALDELDDELPDREDVQAELLIARCEALLAAGDVVSAKGAVAQLQQAAGDSARLAAWGTSFDGQVSMLTDPERLDEIESAVALAAETLAGLDDAAGEANAHTVRAGCLARLGRVADCESALDQALTAARRSGEHRRVNAVLAGAPLAALWGPNPVPRAGGRCLDVVRLLRITTGSPVVEATSTRCQGVLDAFRGRAAAGRHLIESARRTLTELGMRHALLEVDQFAGIVELVTDEPAAAEPHLRRAYDGFRRMRLDADTAESAALLARACLALDRAAEADELCTESERLAGHALKPSIAWRSVRAQLLALSGAHDEARRVAEEAVALAGRTDALVDHGDACLALATVLGAAGDVSGARAAAQEALELYERKGAAALAEKARSILGGGGRPVAEAQREPPPPELDNACVRALRRLDTAFDRRALDELEEQLAPRVTVESRRKVVGITRVDVPADEWVHAAMSFPAIGAVRHSHVVLAVRGDRLALTRFEFGTPDDSLGAPRDELLQLYGLDDNGRIALQVWFDTDDMGAAIAELDALHARFEQQPPRPRLENAATRVDDRLIGLYVDKRFDEVGALFAEDMLLDDRRQGLRNVTPGREPMVENVRAIAAFDAEITKTTIALRGDRLCLSHMRFEKRAPGSDPFSVEALEITEVDTTGLMTVKIDFGPDDLDAAFAELDARYLNGEGAPYAQTWSVIARAHTAVIERRELPATTPGWVNIDHRRGIGVAPGGMTAYIRDAINFEQNMRCCIETVHRLDSGGALLTQVTKGASQEGFDAEWRVIELMMVDGDCISRAEFYDEDDIESALARFDELSRPPQVVENTAARVLERLFESFADRDWVAMASLFANDFHGHDRRSVVKFDIREPDALIESHRVGLEFGISAASPTTLAIRGERLALAHVHYGVSDEQPGAFEVHVLHLVEVDSDERIVAIVAFDLDDIDAAIAELNERYAVGEAAPYAETWAVLTQAYEALNRRELPPATPDWADKDRRRIATIQSGAMATYLRDSWAAMSNGRMYIKRVHRLTEDGAVLTHTAQGTTTEGFDAEWQVIIVVTIAGQLIDRCELFDADDLDAALARFDELSRPVPRLENAACRVGDRLLAAYAARDWAAVADKVADNFHGDDRRRVVNAGLHGRDAFVEALRAIVELGGPQAISDPVAIRAERLVLTRVRYVLGDDDPDAFRVDLLQIVEIDADERMASIVTFDPDDIDAAFEELDARYLAGDAAPYARAWTAVANTFAAINRHELFPTTSDYDNSDHRRGAAFAPGDLPSFIRASWTDTPDMRVRVEAVHRLSDDGAVVTSVAHGTTGNGFDAEWRALVVTTVDGALIRRSELFDESDLDAALARFDELNDPTRPMDNTACRAVRRFQDCFAARDWNTMAQVLADDVVAIDRRPVMRAGTRDGQDINIGDWRSVAEVGFTSITSQVIATRGERLMLGRFVISTGDQRADAYHNDVLGIVELNGDNRVATCLMFDLGDIDTAFDDLDSRYLAGEAAPHARTWSVIVNAYAAFNQREIAATTPEWENVDHRRGAAFAPGEMTAYLQAAWDDSPDTKIYIAEVHRLSNVGAVVTHVAQGLSREGFDAEWRDVHLVKVDGDAVSRCELFNETDLDAALAKFDEFSSAAPPEYAAHQVYERFRECFAARDWDAMRQLFIDNFLLDDRRRTVNAGVRHGPHAEIEDLQAAAEVGFTDMAMATVATRGSHLALARVHWSRQDHHSEAFHNEWLAVLEIDTDERLHALVMFDLTDIEAAVAELDARYLAGEAAAHARTWSVIADGYAAFNRHELPATTPDWVNIDHRRMTSIAPGELFAYVRTSWELAPNISNLIEVVHRLNDQGAVLTRVATGTSQGGFNAEWRLICLVMFDGELLSRVELFDEEDLDAAIAKFDELTRSVPQLENAAIQSRLLVAGALNRRDFEGLIALGTADGHYEDRRKGLRHEARGTELHRVTYGLNKVPAGWILEVVPLATRGSRLALTRDIFRDTIDPDRPITAEHLTLTAVEDSGLVCRSVLFDADDVVVAFAELESHYLAGEAVEYAQTWSVIVNSFNAVNNREPPVTPNWVNVDHRRESSFAPGDLTASDICIYIEAVHRLTEAGAVLTGVTRGASREGFATEWRDVSVQTVDGGMISQCELFDVADIDTALARLDELSWRTTPLVNAATLAWARIVEATNRRDVDGFLAVAAADNRYEDRRKGLRDEGTAQPEVVRALFEITSGMRLETAPLAIRGARLSLTRDTYRDATAPERPITGEHLTLTEVDEDNLVRTSIRFDPDDIDAAVRELDARYAAGEAGAYSDTWSRVTDAYAALNRHELPLTTPDWVNLDHRGATAFASGDLGPYIRAGWDLGEEFKVDIEAVHRLTQLGAVVTTAARGISRSGFDAEWRQVVLLTFEGSRINRLEVFEESDIDAALARLNELSRPSGPAGNAASKMFERIWTHCAAREWDAMAELLAVDISAEDRRRVINDGFRRGREAFVANMRAVVDIGTGDITSAAVATRGQRLALNRIRAQRFHTEVLQLVELDADQRIVTSTVVFDVDDTDGAFAELDARYVAGEAAEHARTWSAVAGSITAVNSHRVPDVTPDWVSIDHRRGAIAFAPGDLQTYLRTLLDDSPQFRVHITAVHRLNGRGAVVTYTAFATSTHGFEVEWREIALSTVDGDRISRCELFDEIDLDAALTRFDELDQPA